MEVGETKDIIDGFKEDFNFVVSIYSSEKYSISSSNQTEYKLKEFFRFWRENYIDCIFANRFDPRELLEAISEMNKQLVLILSDVKQNELNRIVALYFLLCLYVKQPIRLRRKIRLTCHETIQMQALPQILDEVGCKSDAGFVWNLLKSLEAIDIVEESLVYGPTMLIKRGIRKSQDMQDSDAGIERSQEKDFNIFTQNRIDPLLREMNSSHIPYMEAKKSLKLDEYNDSTIEMGNSESIDELLRQAKTLLQTFQYKDR